MRPFAAPIAAWLLAAFAAHAAAPAPPALATPLAPLAPLRHDPFVRPRLGPAPADAASAAAELPRWNAELRAVMEAGKRSAVNVDGHVLTLGEHHDGHRLVRVEDGRAVFSKDGVLTTLTMSPAGQPRK